MSRSEQERKIIEEFVRFYNKQNNTNFLLDNYPEDVDRKVSHRKVDAVYKQHNKTIAIEHTSLDNYINQRKQENELIKALGLLEDELKNKLPVPGYFSFIVPADFCMPRKMQWNKFRKDLGEEIIKKAKLLTLPSLGRLSSLKMTVTQLSSEFYLCRHNLRGKLEGNFYISRFAHAPEEIDKQKETIIKKALQENSEKFLPYVQDGCNTILLLELIDYDWDGIYRSFTNIKRKFLANILPDEIHVINTSFPSWWCSYLKKGNNFSTWEEFIKFDTLKT